MSKNLEQHEEEEDTIAEASWSAIALILGLLLSFCLGMMLGRILTIESAQK